jgi:hypothetical protein
LVRRRALRGSGKPSSPARRELCTFRACVSTREVKGKFGGRKPLAVLAPDAVKLAKQLRRRRRKGAPMSLREIAAELAKRGHLSARGTTYSASAVLSMLGG